MLRHLIPSLLALPLAASMARAQEPVQAPVLRTADSLMRTGQVFRAESLFYLAVRRSPRDPDARLALGRYLAARGALKVGAVLMEEARFFGGDAAQVAREIAPVYLRMHDFRALAMLPASPLEAPERARVEWLRGAPPSHLGPDSVVVPLRSGEALGEVTLTIGGESVEAVIDPGVRGILLDTLWRRRPGVKVFGSGRGAVAVVPTVKMGGLTLTNMAANFGLVGGPRRARIGQDVHGAFMPTFDAAAGRLTLRRGGRLPARGERVPTLVLPTGTWLVRRGSVIPLGSEAGRALTGEMPWTLDARRGEIVVGR